MTTKKTEDLIEAAEIGSGLFHQAICTADDENDVEFFIEAYEHWGPVVDEVLLACDRGHRDTLTGRARAASR
jgi:hypothetical protein